MDRLKGTDVQKLKEILQDYQDVVEAYEEGKARFVRDVVAALRRWQEESRLPLRDMARFLPKEGGGTYRAQYVNLIMNEAQPPTARFVEALVRGLEKAEAKGNGDRT